MVKRLGPLTFALAKPLNASDTDRTEYSVHAGAWILITNQEVNPNVVPLRRRIGTVGCIDRSTRSRSDCCCEFGGGNFADRLRAAALRDFEAGEAFAEDKAEFDNLKAELDKLVQDFQRDQAAMSDDDQVAARQKMASKNADLEYVAKKLQSLQQQNAQRVFQELFRRSPSIGRSYRDRSDRSSAQAQSVIHADLGYNITAKVTDKLNQLPQE